jgi:hypothetical protein
MNTLEKINKEKKKTATIEVASIGQFFSKNNNFFLFKRDIDERKE